MTSVIQRVIRRAKRRLIATRPRGASLRHDLAAFLAMDSVRSVIDVGANEGQSAAEFHDMFPAARIISVEPLRVAYEALLRAAASRPRVHCENVALGEAERSVTLNTFGISQLASLRCADAAEGSEPARMETLAGLAKRLEVGRVDFLKVDVEGYELEVLAGGRELLEGRPIPFVLLEASLTGTDDRFTPLPLLVDNLGRYGYDVFGLYDQSTWQPHGPVVYLNALFVSRPMREAIVRAPSGRKVRLDA